MHVYGSYPLQHNPWSHQRITRSAVSHEEVQATMPLPDDGPKSDAETTNDWKQFVRNVSGEWEGVTATFNARYVC